MFLDEAQEDTVGPLLRVKIEELRGIFLINYFRMSVELEVGGISNFKQQGHPLTYEVSDLSTDVIMHRFPQKLYSKIG